MRPVSSTLASPARLGYHAFVRKASFVLALVAACATSQRPPAAAPALAAGDALSRFAGAVEEGRWTEAWSLLSARWRARETPERLAADLAASGPVGPAVLARARAALASGVLPDVSGRSAALALGEGKAAALVEEDGAWRVDALE